MTFGNFYTATPFGQTTPPWMNNLWCVKGIRVNGTVECLEPETTSSSPGTRQAIPVTPGSGPPVTPGVKVKIKFDWKVTCFCENTPINPTTELPDAPRGPGLWGNAGVGGCGSLGTGGNKNVRSFSWYEEQYEYECRDSNTPPGSIDADPQAGMLDCNCYKEVESGEDIYGIPTYTLRPGNCFGTYETTETMKPFEVGDMYTDGVQRNSGGMTSGDPATIAALRECGAKKNTTSWGNPFFDYYNIQNLEVADCMNKLICCPSSHGSLSNYLAESWIKRVFSTRMGYLTFNTAKCVNKPI
tara:strand:+ start:931 stop:1827 length:897 start_codon:yes stop_codon:yes gene_type:complete